MCIVECYNLLFSTKNGRSESSYKPMLHHCRHIYFPLGGSRHGLARQLIATLVCYTFVFVWHGLSFRMFVWTVLNFLNIVIEAVAKFISTWPAFISFEVRQPIEWQNLQNFNYKCLKKLNISLNLCRSMSLLENLWFSTIIHFRQNTYLHVGAEDWEDCSGSLFLW